MRQISVLGSTGSIGTQTLQVVRNNKDIHVAALAAGSNVDLIEQQIREFRPELAVLWEEKKAEELKLRVADLDVKVSWGMEGLMEAASIPAAETVVTAVVGMIGIRPTIAAIEAGLDKAVDEELKVEDVYISEPKRYRKAAHMFNIHSWAPVYVNVDNIMNMSYDYIFQAASLGATAIMQNRLATGVGEFGYSAHKDPYDKTKW